MPEVEELIIGNMYADEDGHKLPLHLIDDSSFYMDEGG